MNDSHQNLNRRQFLEAAGFTVSLAAVTGCGRAPTETALPFAVQPEGVVPGRMRSYASTCAGCSAGCGLLVGVRDGRPLKMEGMPEHPLSRGGLCAIGQAIPLGIYDSHRLKNPWREGQESNWTDVDTAIIEQLAELKNSGGAVRFVTSTVTSPTVKASIETFLSELGDNAKHIVFDSVSSSAILDAHADTHGARVLPHYRLDRAKVIVSLGADFLGTWISPVEFTAAWRANRVPDPDHPEMSYHAQLEGRMSLTGTNADQRYRVRHEEFGAVLNHLASRIARTAGKTAPQGTMSSPPLPDEIIDDLATRLWASHGKSVVVCDSQVVGEQRLVNYINELIGAYGTTVDTEHPSYQRQGNDSEVLQLTEEILAGSVAALFVAGVDLTHNLPGRNSLADAIKQVPLVVSFAEREDDFASSADFICPDHHPLESWSDAEPVAGVVSVTQPTIRPLGNTRSLVESVDRWMGSSASGRDAYAILQAHWRDEIFPRAIEDKPFQEFWDAAVHDGFVEVEPKSPPVSAFDDSAVSLVSEPANDNLSLVLYSKIALTDSRHAHNPWLQELPDPVTKVTWDNYVCLSETLAREYKIADGDIVRVTTTTGDRIELPALIQPGQHDHVLAIALAYGVRGTDRFANIGPDWLEARPTVDDGELVGKNAAGLIDARGDTLLYTQSGAKLTKLDGRRNLASTQMHHRLEVPRHVAPPGAEMRDPIQQTTLGAFTLDQHAGAVEHHDFGDEQLWPEDHPKPGHHWGMVVDLNACSGCSACLIACQSENNVPVVGKDEVYRQREMHWIRIDRYYSGHDDEVDVAHQPMMCQHCNNAPCETVCPVLATVHGEEGLNQQAYNRCVGTRYCANNCPYKVRRFNWFKYEHDDSLQNLALNPDVTVRSRGVMEKCSMCIQRITDGKQEASRLGLPLEDGAIQTACQQSCPAQAIVFGDMNDPNSAVSAALANPRRYGVLEEFNFRPAVNYLRVVRNRADAQSHDTQDSSHHG